MMHIHPLCITHPFQPQMIPFPFNHLPYLSFSPPPPHTTKIPPISSTKRSLKRRQNLLRTEESPHTHMEVEELPNQNVGDGREGSPIQQEHMDELSPDSVHIVPYSSPFVTNRTQRRFFRKSRRTCSTTPRFRQSISFSRQI